EDAFAAVPRESFLGEGPWRILTPWSPYTTVPERDPALIYQDVVVALDEERGVNNGSPSLHARWMHLVSPRRGERIAHVGAGVGIIRRSSPNSSATKVAWQQSNTTRGVLKELRTISRTAPTSKSSLQMGAAGHNRPPTSST